MPSSLPIDDAEREAREIVHGHRAALQSDLVNAIAAALRKRDEEIASLRKWEAMRAKRFAEARSDERSKIAERLREREAIEQRCAVEQSTAEGRLIYQTRADLLRGLVVSLTSPEETGQ